MKKLILLSVGCLFLMSYGPGNCTLLEGVCNEACLLSEKAIQHPQGSRKSQELFDEAIATCPSFDYPYYEKAVPYAKRGYIKQWKNLIDKAIEIDPVEHLANRGWYHFFFLNNYEAAIKDIEKLDSLNSYDIGLTGDATYHLNLLKGICYDEIGETEHALEVVETQMANPDHFESLYDHIVLACLYLKTNQTEKAIIALKKQETVNDLADNHYYLAQAYLMLANIDAALEEITTGHKYYQLNRTMENPYRELPYEIYQSDIDQLKKLIEAEKQND